MSAPVMEVKVSNDKGEFSMIDVLMFALYCQRARFTADAGIWATTDSNGRVTSLVARGETKEEQSGTSD